MSNSCYSRKFTLIPVRCDVDCLSFFVLFIGILAIDGVSGVGKTTTLDKWHNRTLLGGKWIIHSKFLDYNELRKAHKEFIDKHEKPFIELAYSLTHLLRTITQNDNENVNSEMCHLLLTDRSCISNLVYFLLFFLQCENNYDKLYNVFLQYDNNDKNLPIEVYQAIHDVENAVTIVGKELMRLRYYVIIVIPNNPFIVVDNILKRENFDASFATVDYIRSQSFLFRRFADRLDQSIVSVMRTDGFFTLDDYQLTNHIQFNTPFH